MDQSLGNINDSIVQRTATESLARVALQAPQHSTSSSVYNGDYQEQYTGANNSTDPTLTSQSSGYGSLSGPGSTSHPYNLGNSVVVPQQSNAGFDQPTYSSGEETIINPTHAAALAAAASSNTPQPASSTYGYANAQIVNNGHQPGYSTNGFAPQDWRQWTRTYMQPQLGQPGEYLNTATTLMTLGRGESQGPGNDGQGLVDGSGVQGHVGHHWPEISFPGAANGHLGQQ